MPSKNKFVVREPELAQALNISVQKLDSIIAFFDSDPDDEWNLVEETDYIYLNKGLKERIFSFEGAYAVARYLAAVADKNILSRFIEAITHIKRRIRNAFIQRVVLENCSSLTFRNNRHFLNKKDVVAIFSTSHAKLNRVYEDLRTSKEPLIEDEEYADWNKVRFYSLQGIERIGRVLATELTRKDRREWCQEVHIVASKTIKLLEAEEAKKKQKIDKAKKKAKSRDNHTCQITGEKSSKYNKFGVAAHHIYSSSAYPHLADSVDNLITIKESIHIDFHQWQGGNNKPCTLEALVEYVTLFHADSSTALITLSQFDKRLGKVN